MLSFLNQKSVNNYRQNKPSYIAEDLSALGIPKELAYGILLSRGVFKWLSARLEYIHLTHRLKTTCTETIEKIKQAKRDKDNYHLGYYRGYLKAVEEIRAEMRHINHSSRWQVQHNDRKAQRFLDSLTIRH